MKTHSALPQPILEGWATSHELLSPAQTVGFHYHDLEEWLELVRGQMTFFALQDGSLGYVLRPGDVLHIPRGEVHRAQAGSEQVEYRRYLPIAATADFTHTLSPEELELLRLNLAIPLWEENQDGNAAASLAPHLSDCLVFGRGDGSVVGKHKYLQGLGPRGRRPSDTVRVLNRTPRMANAPAESFLLSTVVTVEATPPDPALFTNLRLFLKQDGFWKCRLWVNFPGDA